MTMRILLAFVLIAAMAVPASAEIIVKPLKYLNHGEKFEGKVVKDDKFEGSRPAVLVFHAWMGPGDNEMKHAKLLAEMGYIVFVADIYGNGIRPKDATEAAAISGKFKADRTLLRRHAKAAFDVIGALKGVDKSRIGAIGFCFGGLTALELTRSGADLKAVVTFHGVLDSPTPQDGKNIKAKILILHGADDPFNSPKDIAAFQDELRAAHVDWQMVYFGGAVHSFTDESAGTDNSKGAAYNALADKRSWKMASEFLSDVLGK